MKYIILFEDNRAADPEIRKNLMSDHLAFLEGHADQIDAAGPLHTPTGEGAGGIWIVESENERAADRLVKKDPFWPTGLRKSYQILVWTQVYADGRRMIQPSSP